MKEESSPERLLVASGVQKASTPLEELLEVRNQINSSVSKLLTRSDQALASAGVVGAQSPNENGQDSAQGPGEDTALARRRQTVRIFSGGAFSAAVNPLREALPKRSIGTVGTGANEC